MDNTNTNTNTNRNIEIMKVYRSVNERFRMLRRERFRHLNLTGAQGMMMGMIAHQGPIKMSELSQHMNLSTSTVSEMVNRLEKLDMVIRKRDENDRRIVRVELSETYQKKSSKECGHFEKFASDLFSTATDEEIETILDGLNALDKLFESKIKSKEEETQHD